MSYNHQGDVIILILVIKIMKIGRFVILKGISITRVWLDTFNFFELVFFLIVELSWQNICLLILMWMLCKCPLLNCHEKHPPFRVWKSTLSWWSRKSHPAEPRNNSFIISLHNLKYERALKFTVWKTSQRYKPPRLQHREQFIHVIWLHRVRKQCTSLQPFMNLLVNVMSFLRNKISHHHPGRGILDQM